MRRGLAFVLYYYTTNCTKIKIIYCYKIINKTIVI